MAYNRGNQSVEVELARCQSWIEQADRDLYGEKGDNGVIREHRDNRANLRMAVALCAIFGGAVPTILAILHAFGLLH
jgi:RNase P/RNase MRP subunit POP5